MENTVKTPDLKIVALSLDIIPFSPSDNIEVLRKAIERLSSDVDIVILPELFTTGYTDSPETLALNAESNSGETVSALMDIAASRNMAIAGSFLGRTLGDFYNRGFFIEPSGDYTFFDKKHLFSLSTEPKVFKPGQEPSLTIVRFRGWSVAMAICYDLRFPAWCRNSTENPYDILLVPANWPTVRQYAWKHLLIARAIENQAYVAGVNRSGSDEYGDYSDSTEIFDFLGRKVGESLKIEGVRAEVTEAVCEASKLKKFRRSFPVLSDADPFILK